CWSNAVNGSEETPWENAIDKLIKTTPKDGTTPRMERLHNPILLLIYDPFRETIGCVVTAPRPHVLGMTMQPDRADVRANSLQPTFPKSVAPVLPAEPSPVRPRPD